MDTSETYIKMCDCPEIQEQSVTPPYPNDYYARRKGGGIRYGYQIITSDIVDDDYIWLPRQDQIQEIARHLYGEHSRKWVWRMMQDFVGNLDNDFYLESIEMTMGNYFSMDGMFDTWEQLWLAFYMYEKYQKIWTGEKWIDNE